MAALIREARAARAQAERLRVQTRALRGALRETNAYSREQLLTAEEALSRVQSRLGEPLPSPWSTLEWSYDRRPLAGVLVAI